MSMACTQVSENAALRCGIRMSLRQVMKPHMKKIAVTTASAMRVLCTCCPRTTVEVSIACPSDGNASHAAARHGTCLASCCPALSDNRSEHATVTVTCPKTGFAQFRSALHNEQTRLNRAPDVPVKQG